MEPIMIAHLSDLHFGEKKKEDANVWEELVKYINDTLKPHLILITGDIVNTPDSNLFKDAKGEIDKLRPRAKPEERYRVCPGNHDRFWLGNSAAKAPGIIARILGRNAEQTNLARPAHGELENYFKGGLVLTPEYPFNVTLPSEIDAATNGNSWKLRVLGCDSCEEDVYFAQGLLNTRSIGALRSVAMTDSEADLVILMVHHHLLPIADLEKERSGLRDLANVTGMLNAGTALNMLAASHVNLVLHGHEHYAQAAKFRTLDGANGEVAVVAAGSCTGTKTLGGWSMKRARFNVLELHPDRSVVLREISGQRGYFDYANQPPVQLLGAEDIRRARFQRKAIKVGERTTPRSHLTKVFELRHDRDGVITETRTDWLIGEKWVMPTQNGTGTPTTATVEFDFGDSVPLERSADFVRTLAGDNSYTATFDLQGMGSRRVNRVVTSWSWEAGAILTMDEVDTLPDPGPFRKDGKEFVAVQAPDSDLEELTLVLKVPEEFAPKHRQVEVWTSDKNTPMKWEKNIGLGELAQSVGRGLFSLRVPFPLPQWRYALCWPMSPGPGEAKDLLTHLKMNSATVHDSICRALFIQDGLPHDASVALYLRRPKTNLLERVALKGNAAPETLDLHEQSGIVRGVWWGRLRTMAPEENDSSSLFVPGDSYVALAPIRQPDGEIFPAAGLVRVAISSPFNGVDNTDNAQVAALRSVLAKAPGLWHK